MLDLTSRHLPQIVSCQAAGGGNAPGKSPCVRGSFPSVEWLSSGNSWPPGCNSPKVLGFKKGGVVLSQLGSKEGEVFNKCFCLFQRVSFYLELLNFNRIQPRSAPPQAASSRLSWPPPPRAAAAAPKRPQRGPSRRRRCRWRGGRGWRGGGRGEWGENGQKH